MCFFGLHCTEDEFSKEEESNNGNCDVLLLILAGEDRDKNISDRADTDTICNGVGKRHHDKG